ncbi:MAG: hypothetical protein ACK4NM_18485, partial [Hydrogenophaga sp.]
MPGGLHGPKNAECPARAWSYQFCAGLPCNQYRQCRTCLADAFCGWCLGEDETGMEVGSCTEAASLTG